MTPRHQKNIKIQWVLPGFLKLNTFVDWSFLDPFLSHKSMGFGPKHDPKSIKNWFRNHTNFWNVFWIVFDPFWIPFWNLLAPFWAPFWTLGGSRGHLGATFGANLVSQSPVWGPKCSSMPPRCSFGDRVGPFGLHFWSFGGLVFMILNQKLRI